MNELPIDVDTLYRVSPGDFVKRRDRLVTELEEAGRDEEASLVKKLKRPTLAAWALNQTVRRQPKQIEWLLEADEKVRSAKTRAGFKEASEARQDLISRLTGAAVGILTKSGNASTAAVREKITNTLLAMALDDEARELVREGRLEKEIEPGGFGPAESGLASLKEAPDAAERKKDEKAARLRNEAESLVEEGKHLRQEAKQLASEAKKIAEKANHKNRAAKRAEEQAKSKIEQAEEQTKSKIEQAEEQTKSKIEQAEELS